MTKAPGTDEIAKNRPPPLPCGHEQGRGAWVSASGPIFDLPRVSIFQFFKISQFLRFALMLHPKWSSLVNLINAEFDCFFCSIWIALSVETSLTRGKSTKPLGLACAHGARFMSPNGDMSRVVIFGRAVFFLLSLCERSQQNSTKLNKNREKS